MRGAWSIALVLLLGGTGCPGDGGECAGVGASCVLLCCANLTCHAGESGGYCTKSCRCDTGRICAPSTFEDGCPQGSVCLAQQADGSGECVRLCDSSPCAAGEVLCEGQLDPNGDVDAGVIGCHVVTAAPDLGAR